MPLFSGKFTYKKSRARKVNSNLPFHRDLSQTYPQYDYTANDEPIKLNLGQQNMIFDTKTGQWLSNQSIDKEIKDTESLKTDDLVNKIELLNQENMLLKLKLEILLQMATEATAELQLQGI